MEILKKGDEKGKQNSKQIGKQKARKNLKSVGRTQAGLDILGDTNAIININAISKFNI